MCIRDRYQTGILPKNAVKIETPQNIEEMMKKAAPIAAVLCVLMFVTMLCKTVMNIIIYLSPCTNSNFSKFRFGKYEFKLRSIYKNISGELC